MSESSKKEGKKKRTSVRQTKIERKRACMRMSGSAILDVINQPTKDEVLENSKKLWV